MEADLFFKEPDSTLSAPSALALGAALGVALGVSSTYCENTSGLRLRGRGVRI
jgi:hypothetical protein